MADRALSAATRALLRPAQVGSAGATAAPTADARRDYRRLYLLMSLTDVLSVAVALAFAYQIRFGFRTPSPDELLLLGLAPLLVPPIFALFRLYQVHHFTGAEEFRRLLLAVTVTISLWITASFWSRSPLSREWISLSWLFGLAFVLGSRRLWRTHVRRSRSAGRLQFRTLIVGTNGEALRLARAMFDEKVGFEPLGYVTTEIGTPEADTIPVLGHIAGLHQLIRDTKADCVFVASTSLSREDMALVSQVARREEVEVHLTANLPEVVTTRLAIQALGGGMALTLRPARLSGAQAMAKRAFDLLVSTVALAVATPVLAVVALLVKATSRGPVLYRQERVGLRGERFTIIKFRTMVQEAERMLDDLRAINEADGPLFKLRHDPRVTPVGRWLRRLSIDELPQLVNVIRGDMTLVGPRPPLPSEVMEYETWHFDRLEVRPGITGLWQVSGRSNASFEDYVRLDLFYIENWSLSMDLFILAKTIPKALLGRGAY